MGYLIWQEAPSSRDMSRSFRCRNHPKLERHGPWVYWYRSYVVPRRQRIPFCGLAEWGEAWGY